MACASRLEPRRRAALLALLAGCAPASPGEDTAGTADTTASAGESDTAGTFAASTTDDPTTGDEVVPCDNWAQNCPDGEKCSAYAADGADAFNALRCVPVTGSGAPGDACRAEGLTGVDDCEPGAMCWYTDDSGAGICVPLCTGTAEEHAGGCTPGFRCALSLDGVLNLCLPGCDPLVQDCGPGRVCVHNGFDYSCRDDASGPDGGLHDACSLPEHCDPGFECVDPSFVSACNNLFWDGCCTPFCALSGGDAPCMGDACVPVAAADDPWLLFADLGVCMRPA